jgi:hypothetical protein
MERHRYRNPLIEEARCEIRFAPGQEWNPTISRHFHAKQMQKNQAAIALLKSGRQGSRQEQQETLRQAKRTRHHGYRSDRFCPGDEPMSTDTEVRIRGLRALVEALGTVEAERFITLILREPFDYTQWQRQLWTDKSVDEISKAAMAMRNTSPNERTEPTR